MCPSDSVPDDQAAARSANEGAAEPETQSRLQAAGKWTRHAAVAGHVSVILAGYADRQRLAEAMSWAAEQVLAKLELELVIVGSVALVGEALGQHRGARVVAVEREPRHAGATDRELGLAAAGGAFVAFLEPGDHWYVDHLERLAQLLTDEPGLGLAFGPVAEVCSQAGTQVLAPDVDRLRSQGRAAPKAEALAGVLPKWTISGIVARREALRSTAPGMLFDRSQDQALDRQKWAELTSLWSIDGIAATPSESAKTHARPQRVLLAEQTRSKQRDADGQAPSEDLVCLDAALTELGKLEPELVKLVELRFFGELSMVEVARILGTSLRVAQRDWSLVKHWLRARLALGV